MTLILTVNMNKPKLCYGMVLMNEYGMMQCMKRLVTAC